MAPRLPAALPTPCERALQPAFVARCGDASACLLEPAEFVMHIVIPAVPVILVVIRFFIVLVILVATVM
eukprot:7793368-Lingulodinium_polyedra.AAC.1